MTDYLRRERMQHYDEARTSGRPVGQRRIEAWPEEEYGTYARWRGDPTSRPRSERWAADRGDEWADGPDGFRSADARISSSRWSGAGRNRWTSYPRNREHEESAPDPYGRVTMGDEAAAGQLDLSRDRGYAGKGPRAYRRSDERICEDVNEALTRHPGVDATDVTVTVKDCEVTLTGTVSDRRAKRAAEDAADSVAGVIDVQNQLRVTREQSAAARSAPDPDRTTPGE